MMTDPYHSHFDAHGDQPAVRQRSKVPAILAWLAIFAVAGGMFVLNNFVPESEPRATDQPTNPESEIVEDQPQAEPAKDAVGLAMMKLQARLLIGQYQMTGDPDGKLLEQAATMLNTGSVDQRLRFVTIAGEIAGPAEALDTLDDLEERVANAADAQPDNTAVVLSSTHQQLISILRTLYTEYHLDQWEAPSLDEANRAVLLDELGWFGELALAPPNVSTDDQRSNAVSPAIRTFGVMIAASILGIGVGFLGFIGLVLVIIFACLRQVRSRLGGWIAYHGIYAETFAVWLLLFIGLGAFGGMLFPMPDGWELMSTFIAFFLSLLALCWPRIRGVKFSQIRYDIGWRFSEQPLMDIIHGFTGYAMTLPLLGIGLILTLLFTMLQGAGTGMTGGGGIDSFDPTGGPAHPIIQHVANPTFIGMLQVYLIASIAAPIVEETMFRGVLYKHLRSATHSWSLVVSILFSCLLNGVLFAMIHPQGWIAIPVLASLAIGMSLLREWRGSVVPSMILHGLSNGLVMTMLLLAMG